MFFLKIPKPNLILNLPKTSKNVRFYVKTAIPPSETVNMAFRVFDCDSSSKVPPLIIMHGLFGSKRNWKSFSGFLQKQTVPQRKIITVDARNHGSSPHANEHTYLHMAEDIKVLLNKLKIQKASLLGYSMGGRAMMTFALKYPQLVDKLIVIEITPIAKGHSAFAALFPVFAALQQVELPKSNMSLAAAWQHCHDQLARTIKAKDMRDFLLINLKEGSSGNYEWKVNLDVLIKHFPEHIDKFPKIHGLTFTGPTLFIAGQHSEYVRKSDTPEILKIFPKAEFAIIKDSGHWVHIDNPVHFIKVCADFLNKK